MTILNVVYLTFKMIEMNEKTEIINGILNAGTINGYNSMGVSESWYNAWYLIKKCFMETEDGELSVDELKVLLGNMSIDELKNLEKLADFATEVFY